ncbi:MAG: heme-binding protein [Parafilimonas terrae]|nr:heme-binding protein [Parafilimonas terrae]
MRKTAQGGLITAAFIVATLGVSPAAHAQSSQDRSYAPPGQGSIGCPVTYDGLKKAVTKAAGDDSTGFNNDYWAVAVDRTGVVCAVAYSGPAIDSQWLGSRQIAAAKAYTANAFSLSVSAGRGPLSTAQLYGFVQPSPSGGNPLFGLEGGNVLASEKAYDGQYFQFGSPRDPMIGQRVGGTITFGGGLTLYSGNTAIGAIGVSGDTACADHSVAWRIRGMLNLRGPQTDTITLVKGATPATGGHPDCPNSAGTQGQTGTM